METKNKKENLQLIIFSIVGAVISVLSFFSLPLLRSCARYDNALHSRYCLCLF